MNVPFVLKPFFLFLAISAKILIQKDNFNLKLLTLKKLNYKKWFMNIHMLPIQLTHQC